MPSACLWPHVASTVEEPWLPAIIYPATGIAGLWQAPAAPPGALSLLLGRARPGPQRPGPAHFDDRARHGD